MSIPRNILLVYSIDVLIFQNRLSVLPFSSKLTAKINVFLSYTLLSFGLILGLKATSSKDSKISMLGW